MMKICSVCGVKRHVSDFYEDRARRHQREKVVYQRRCKLCEKARGRARYRRKCDDKFRADAAGMRGN